MSGAAAKRLGIAVGVVLVALLAAGLVTGAIGSAILDRDPLVPQPEIHLPPQPIFPAAVRHKHLGMVGKAGTTARPNPRKTPVRETMVSPRGMPKRSTIPHRWASPISPSPTPCYPPGWSA